MFGLSKLFGALSALASALTSLADTINQVNAGVRTRLMLDQEEQPALPQILEQPAESVNGRRKKVTTEN